jgi:predicted Zn-ribbon and HTH transcriptional regulator
MMICPECDSENVEVPTVDIGVGEQQCAPASCLDCGWVQPMPDYLVDNENDFPDPFPEDTDD